MEIDAARGLEQPLHFQQTDAIMVRYDCIPFPAE